MGFIAVKGTSWYWVVSKRNKKKDGGDGKVRKIWYYIGDKLEYIDFYFYEKIISPDDFKMKYILAVLNCYGLKNRSDYTFSVNSKNKLKVHGINVDFRVKGNREILDVLKHNFEIIVYMEKNSVIKANINDILESIRKYNDCIDCANKAKDTDLRNSYVTCADHWWHYYESGLNELLKKIPQQFKENFKKQITKRVFTLHPLKTLD